jgi:GNAT superfamily N-acetyltransferase
MTPAVAPAASALRQQTSRAAGRRHVEVRPAHPEDDDAIRMVLAEAFAEFEPFLPPRLFRAHMDNLLDVDGRRAVSEVLVAELADEIVGTASYYGDATKQRPPWPEGWAGVRAVGVSPRARGLGAGRRLLEACVERASDQSAPALALHTAPFMQAATALYERIGFRRAGRFDADLGAMSGVAGLRILGYVKPLAPGAAA